MTTHSIAWTCDACRVCGLVFWSEDMTINQIVAALQWDHAERSPECKSGDRLVRTIAELDGVRA